MPLLSPRPPRTPEQERYLPALFLQVFGCVLLLVFIGFWMATGRESVLLVGAAGSMILLGGYERVRQSLVEVSQTPPAPPAPAPPAPPPENP